MEAYIGVAQILISVLLVGSILLQVRGQGGGLFGSAQGTFRVRRGIDKLLFQATIVLTIIFLLISILSVRFFSGT
jgi:preprotein translocase subunit SecG